MDNSGVDGRWRDAMLLVEPRRRRRVARLLRRLDRLDARRARRRVVGEHRRPATAVGVLVLLLGGLFVASMLGEDPSSGGSGFPDRPADAQAAPIGSAQVDGGTSDEYSFIRTQDNSSDPVTYDPCVPIHVVVATRTMVDDGMELLEEALDEVRDATGLSFVVDGVTEEDAPDNGTVTDPDGGWLPVTVSWSDPEASEKLKGDVAGYAGSASVERDGRRWFVTGSVVLDGPQLDDIMDRRRGRASARSVVMHELGHLVGLDHVDASGQLMQPEGSEALTTWGRGDLTGLAALGRGRCIAY